MRSFAEPLVPGVFEDRTPVGIVLADRHGLGVGRSGSGKSTLQEVFLYELLACRDVVVWAVDLGKRGVRFRDLEPALGWLVQEEAEARAMFAALPEIQDARARWMAEAGHKRWPLSPECPQLVVVVDEYVDLMAVDGCDEQAAEVARKGREQGISLFAWSQRGTSDGLGGSVFVKRQAELRIALAMDAEDVDFVLERGAHAAGFHPEHFQDRGMFYVRTPDLRAPRPARGFLPDDDQGRRIAARWEPYRPQLESAAAEIVERLRPAPGERALPAAAVKPATEAERRLLELVDAAPAGGITPAELEAAMAELAVKRSWIIAKLPQFEKHGRVRKVTRGRWVGAGTTGRSELIVLDGGGQ
jgi:S-DNA-T family DNA segregation ATPase FtsK/SpoIIIE